MRITSTTADFLSQLRPHADKPLVFLVEDHRIRAGYHVTEIKAASFASLDCGSNPERWSETIIQLWDVPGNPGERHMTAGKFLRIYEETAKHVPVEPASQLTFEYGDQTSPAIHLTPGGVSLESDAVVVHLEPIRATCKPRDRRSQLADTNAGLSMLEPTSSVCCSVSTPPAQQTAACC